MTTLRDIRKKIHSVNNIQKITHAMEVVAASRLRKAQAKVESARPYALKLQEMLDLLLAASHEVHHPLIHPREVKKIGLVVIGGDRGLCGGYNQNIFNTAENFLHEYTPDQVELILIGRKPIEHFKTKRWSISFQIEEWGGKITHSQIEELTQFLITSYLEGQLDAIWLVYTHFIHMTAKKICLDKFLNIETTTIIPANDKYMFEPDPFAILSKMLPRYCMMKIQFALNDAYTAELAARIFAMRAATKNAEEMIEKLTLIRNKVRQSGITKELIEITSGAESLGEL